MRQLKIDRSFVMQMTLSENNDSIVRSTIELARSLNLAVVAEGVETPEQLAALQDYGCDTAQGYHISRPVPPHELERWIARTTTPDTLEPVGRRSPPRCQSGSKNGLLQRSSGF